MEEEIEFIIISSKLIQEEIMILDSKEEEVVNILLNNLKCSFLNQKKKNQMIHKNLII